MTLSLICPPTPADRRVAVLLPYPFPGPFDYGVPDGMSVVPGDVVVVPLNRREEIGVVWDTPPEGAVPDHKLKTISGVLDTPRMGHSLRQFVDWIAAYTLAPPGDVLAMALRVNAETVRPVMMYRQAAEPPKVRVTPPRQRVLDALAVHLARTGTELMRAASVSSAVLRGMVDAGLLHLEAVAPSAPFQRPDPDYPGPPLSEQQSDVARGLRAAVAARAFSVTLLDGVTGSGKTEVYLEAVAEALRHGRQALVMLPEIALSTQWSERFERRFGAAPAIWHSDLPRP